MLTPTEFLNQATLLMERLTDLAAALRLSPSYEEKLECLDKDPNVIAALQRPGAVRTFLAGLPLECEVVVKSLIAIGQAKGICLAEKAEEGFADRMRALLEDLLPVERFYREIGGLVGYHVLLLTQIQNPPSSCRQGGLEYHRPEGLDLFSLNAEVRKHVLNGIRFLPLMAEIYPVGGAADRLRLYDPQTKIPLPAARLKFCGKTLLEWMVQDLQAREYLYFKLFHAQVTVPIAMMTSQEKDNHAQILALCEERRWFGRSASSFAFFCQPAVPTMDKEGNWCFLNPFKPVMKPGGHGVIWKLAKDQGIFDWLAELGKRKVVVRQINNPIAGIDYGLMAFSGIGCEQDKAFGFASCLRQVKAAEGVNVLIETKEEDHRAYCLTNIEYCDFDRYGIEDVPVHVQSCYSLFPSNTNILFADIAHVSDAVARCPIPGMIVNLKKMTFQDEQGVVREEELARLESTMQNIADAFVDRVSCKGTLEQRRDLSAFLTYNHRHKTISTVKKELVPGGALLETPEGCYWDIYCNAHDLLQNHCRFSLPDLVAQSDYLESGPSFDFSYHPCLGPVYAVIAQKLRGGKLSSRSRLHLAIAELDCENLDLQGRLSIVADLPMGQLNSQGKLEYSDRGGRCRLINVAVVNQGLLEPSSSCWKSDLKEGKGCEIILHGDSEFEARDLTLSGDLHIEVEEGFCVVAALENGQVVLKKQALSEKRWSWRYEVDNEDQICLRMA